MTFQGTLTRLRAASTVGQRRAALGAAACLAALLVAAIVLVVLSATGALGPEPSSEAQLRYVLAQRAEATAVAQAEAAGIPLATAPLVVSARTELVLAELALGQTSEAAARASRLVRDNPKNAAVRLAHALALEQSGRQVAATNEFGVTLKLATESEVDVRRTALTGFAHGLISRGDKPAALDALTQAALLPPASPDLFIEAGDLAVSLKEWQQAARNYYQARRFEPDNDVLARKITELEKAHSAEAVAAQTALETSGGLDSVPTGQGAE